LNNGGAGGNKMSHETLVFISSLSSKIVLKKNQLSNGV